MAHTFDAANADRLEGEDRFRYCSRDELVALVDPDDGDVVLDLGSGTGFYTQEVAPSVDTLLALDVQVAMHELYGAKGVPAHVHRVTADAEMFPLRPESIDAVYSTMTFHEVATAPAMAECARVLRARGRFVAVDWSAEGAGEAGPPLGERQSAESASTFLEDAGFDVVRAEERPETFVVLARA